jgi:TolB-like protein/tetratricopeptide (TPR) repeat protein/DNA-binding winged helix-turn-helix (wHTH) protein
MLWSFSALAGKHEPMREGFRLGELIVDPTAGRVLRADGWQHLSSRASAAMAALAARPGELLQRSELLAILWPDGSGSEHTLARCVGNLRHALGDSGRPHRYVETVAGQGYRLIAQPQPLSAADRSQLASPGAAAAAEPSFWERIRDALLSGSREQRLVKLVPLYVTAATAIVKGMREAGELFPRIAISDSILRFLVLLAVLGLPLVIGFAWLYKPRAIGASASWRRNVLRPLATGLAVLGALGALALGLSKWLGTPVAPVAADRSIAVLPFDNLSGDPANEYVGDGLAEELANRLTRVPDLQVASRTSAFAVKGQKLNIEQIAAELGVHYVIEGSVRRSGDTLLVTSQLIDGPSGFHVWSKTYRRPMNELQNIEDDISGSVIEALRIVLAPETLARVNRADVQGGAHEAYLQGISELRQFTDASSLDRASRHFQQAIAIDPTYAEAYAGLCQALVQRYMKLQEAAAVTKAEEACDQATRLDSGLADVHLALGQLYVATGQPVAAEREYRRAADLDPDLVEARVGLATSLRLQGRAGDASREYQRAIALRPRYWMVYEAYGSFLIEQGDLREAAAQYRRGLDLAPSNATLSSNLGAALFLAGNFEEAADAFRRSVEIAPTSEGYSNTATMYYYAGRYAEAAEMFEQAARLAPQDYQVRGNLADAYRQADGRSELARAEYGKAAELARESLAVNPESALTRTALAYYLVRQGEATEAARELETARQAAGADLYTHYYAALVSKELGDMASAVHETRLAIEAGMPMNALRADPEFRSILGEPDFAAKLVDSPTNHAEKPTDRREGD